MGAYLAALRLEVDRAVEAGMPVATSVFFGGGTPSLVPRRRPDGGARRRAPGPVGRGDRRVQPGHGVARPAPVLPRPRRVADQPRRAVDGAARAGLARPHARSGQRPSRRRDGARPSGSRRGTSTSSTAAPGSRSPTGSARSSRHWRSSRRTSRAYALTVEAGTPLAADPARHPDDDDQADKYIVADSAASAGGLASYEISNWARPGHECHHNLLYWDQGDYLGFGCAAHSHQSGGGGGTCARRSATSRW